MKRTILKIIFGVLCAVGIGLIILLLLYICKKIRPHLLLTSIIVIGVVMTLVCTGYYIFNTTDVNQVDSVVKVKDSRYYIDDGLLSQTHYVQYHIVPTDITLADKVYRVKVDNGIVNWSNKIMWTQLELDIGKSMFIKHKISADEYNALSKMSWYNIVITEVRSERELSLMLLPLAYSGMIMLGWMVVRERKINQDSRIVITPA